MAKYFFAVEGEKAEFNLITNLLLNYNLITKEDEKVISQVGRHKVMNIKTSLNHFVIYQLVPQQPHCIYKTLSDCGDLAYVDIVELLTDEESIISYEAIYILIDVDAYMSCCITREVYISGIKNLSDLLNTTLVDKSIPTPCYLLISSPRIEAAMFEAETILESELSTFPHNISEQITKEELQNIVNIANQKYEGEYCEEITLENSERIYNNLGDNEIKVLSPVIAFLCDILAKKKSEL